MRHLLAALPGFCSGMMETTGTLTWGTHWGQRWLHLVVDQQFHKVTQSTASIWAQKQPPSNCIGFRLWNRSVLPLWRLARQDEYIPSRR